MKRYFLEIAYNGSNFHGWQVQKGDIRTVQGELDKALFLFLRQKITTLGCGRTDTGVHAKQFFLHFDIEELPTNFLYSLNGALPKDIVAYNVVEVDKHAHARFDATARTYEYYVHQRKNPFHRGLSYFVPKSLDIDLMNEASSVLLNTDDFTSFSKLHSDAFTNLCDVSKAKWTLIEQDKLIFEIRANRFLRNMVRAVVGTTLEVGMGKITVNDFKDIIEKKDRGEAGKSVDGGALFLSKVDYPYL